MQEVNGSWIMYGCDWNDAECIHTVDEAVEYINKIGFLPLFANEIPGFSLEERTAAECWWCDDAARDPWIWRELIAGRGDIAYGKFFDKKAGFISKEWLPYFINFRRDGYDFDALWDDEKASVRQKKIMDLFDDSTELFSYDIKQRAGFGKDGEANFEGTITGLQMQMYLCMSNFRRKRNKQGKEYGWNIALYSKPERIWGSELVTSRYCESAEESRQAILNHIRDIYPIANEKQLKKVLG